jgi:hypothetical protein
LKSTLIKLRIFAFVEDAKGLPSFYWDVMQNPSNPPTSIDQWVATHGIALVVNRVDGRDQGTRDRSTALLEWLLGNLS